MNTSYYKRLDQMNASEKKKGLWDAFTQLVYGLDRYVSEHDELRTCWRGDVIERIDSYGDCWCDFSKLTNARFEELKTLCDDILDGLELFDLYRFDDLDPDYRATDKYFKRGVIDQIKKGINYQGLNRKRNVNVGGSIPTAEQLNLFPREP